MHNETKKKPVLLSVITAAFNARSNLPGLIESLRSQSDQEFEWIVADGGSTDGTLELLANVTDLNLKIDSCADFGVYDALNRAIKVCSGDYYLVCGADDRLDENAIHNYKKEILESKADIITAKIQVDNKAIGPKKFRWLYGVSALISSHSVGAIFKKSLHEKYGYYSKSYPICSDKLFVEKAVASGVSLTEADFVAGTYAYGGMSSTHVAETLCQNFCIQIAMGRNKLVQLSLLCLRVIKNYRKI
jgi:glycosyltransferase involved in cell wall biosynthesis